MAFIVVLHLAPSEESHLAEILQRATRMEVSQVKGTERVEPNRVYVIAPATALSIRDGSLTAGAPEVPHYRARPIDAFFSALAADQKETAVGIVLSGTGSDGAAGLKEICAAGGLCLVQDPETAEYGAMPLAAIETGAAEAAVPPGEMGEILGRYAATPRVRPTPKEPAEPAAGEQREGLPAILDLLGERYRVDFRDYKTGTLERRIERRASLKHIIGSGGYLDYLRTHPEEVDQLYRDLLIGVTEFFRDADAWDHLARNIVPTLIEQAQKNDATAVRVWSAGCATGEEAYSLAMVFLEHLESSGSRLKLRVFASDVSDAALAIARLGRYSAGIRDQVSPARLKRFFRRAGDGFEVDPRLRDTITFASHDLLSDPPFAQLELVSCRNLLIYLQAAGQERLLERFHFSLRSHGVLWLGAAETIGRRTDLFEEVSGKHRVYRSIGVARRRAYPRARRGIRLAPEAAAPEDAAPIAIPRTTRQLEKLVLERCTSPSVVIDQGLAIRHFFGPTDRYLTRPQGEAKLDLLSWVRPELYAKLRSGLSEAIERKQPVTLTGMRLERDAALARVEIVIEPITSIARTAGLFLVVFRDLPAPRIPAADETAEDTGADDGQLRQELLETREDLRAAVDQLRIAAEEHSASYEELLSLNEEFQSSNEELEASKEELQSMNEELTTINHQLEERNDELHSITADLDNLLVSTNIPTIFLDRNLRMRRFTPACATIMSIGPDILGRTLRELELPVHDESLLSDVGRVLAQGTALDAEVVTTDDRWFFRRALPYRAQGGAIDGVCLTFQEITAQKQAAEASEYARLYAEAIIRGSRTPLLVLDMDLRLVSANSAFFTTFQVDEEHAKGQSIYALAEGQWDIPTVRTLLRHALDDGRGARDYDFDHVFQKIGWRSLRLNADVIRRDGRPDLVLLSIEDVTDLRRSEMVARRQADELELDDRRKNEFLAMLGHELRNPLAALTNGLDLLRLTGGTEIESTRAMMERQTRRTTSMLDQLLDVARVVSGKLELTRGPTDVAEAAKAAIEGVRPMLDDAGHELAVSLPPAGEALVLGDAMRLAQVIENLLGNAVKYTESGGRIWLALEPTGDTITLWVRDNGIGLEPDVLEHIFDLFSQAPVSLHRARGGLGLGLPLVRNVVQMHGGSVKALSAGPGQGTEIVVTLPRLRGESLPPAETEQPAELVQTPHRILVVDDEADAANALVEILTHDGHQVRAVLDGPSALEAAEELEPEIVFLDLGLPRMDGYEVARHLRERLGKAVLLVALTGYKDDQDLLDEAGFDGHLLKPTKLDLLLDWIAKLDRRALE